MALWIWQFSPSSSGYAKDKCKLADMCLKLHKFLDYYSKAVKTLLRSYIGYIGNYV